MRQIHVCAWLCVTALALAACSGGEFTTSEQEGSTSGGSKSPSGIPDRGEDEGARAGSRSLGSGAGSSSGGSASAGASSSGGGSASAGAPSSGGAGVFPPNGGGSSAEDCVTGSVKIRMLPGAKLPQGFLCDASCGTGWLTIMDAEGATAFSISAACGTASCDTCEVQPCGAAACLPTALTSGGSELVWTGTYLAKDTCGDHMACQRKTCVKPGRYKARACAALNQGESDYGCKPNEAQLCAEAEFEFPSTEHVELVLDQ